MGQQADHRTDRDEDASDPSVVLEELRDADRQSQHHRSRETGPLQEALPRPDRQHPGQQERGVGERHARERDMRPGECSVGCGRGPCPAAERPTGHPADRGDRQRPCRDRDEDRRRVANAQEHVGPTDEEWEAGRCVRDRRRIESQQAARREYPQAGERIDPLVEMDQSEPAQRPESERTPDQGQRHHDPEFAREAGITSPGDSAHAVRF